MLSFYKESKSVEAFKIKLYNFTKEYILDVRNENLNIGFKIKSLEQVLEKLKKEALKNGNYYKAL